MDDYQYAYDAASNRTKQTVQIGAGTPAVTMFAYNQLSQLCWKVGGTSAADCSTTPAGATSYGYDLNGNQTSGGRSYGYNSKDQTISINGTALTYLGLDQNELTGIGSDTFQNNGMGVAEQTSGSSTYRFRGDPGGTLIGTSNRAAATTTSRTRSARRWRLRTRPVRWPTATSTIRTAAW